MSTPIPIPRLRRPARTAALLVGMLAAIGPLAGCATMRRVVTDLDLRPCSDEYAETADGWRLGVRHLRPARYDPGKDPVVLCHGLGLNGTFWTLTDDNLARQLVDRGYEVFIVDMRGSGASHRIGTVGWVNSGLRQTFLREIASSDWTMDDEARFDVPAILEHVGRTTGHARVNWVGHSLGGMLMFPFLERSPMAPRIANFVAMGSPACVARAPQTKMLNANRNLRKLLSALSTGRAARPLSVARPSILAHVDKFYYTAANVDRATIDRFYGFTLEDPGPGALKQLDAYLEHGHLVSADRKVDYFENLDLVTTPILMVAGEGDVLADIDSTQRTFDRIASADKTLARYGRRDGHRADYGHCDLVWSRHAPKEIFPDVIDWLDARQPTRATPQGPTGAR